MSSSANLQCKACFTVGGGPGFLAFRPGPPAGRKGPDREWLLLLLWTISPWPLGSRGHTGLRARSPLSNKLEAASPAQGRPRGQQDLRGSSAPGPGGSCTWGRSHGAPGAGRNDCREPAHGGACLSPSRPGSISGHCSPTHRPKIYSSQSHGEFSCRWSRSWCLRPACLGKRAPLWT